MVEVDDIIGWEITLSKASPETRNYVIEASVLDPASDEHPIPCGCQSARYSKLLLLVFFTNNSVISTTMSVGTVGSVR